MKTWIKNYKKSSKKITKESIYNFLYAMFYYLVGVKWRKDQAKWREAMIKVKSPICLEQGYCKKCYCDFPAKLYELEECEQGCYPKWKSKKEWYQFKKSKEYQEWIKQQNK